MVWNRRFGTTYLQGSAWLSSTAAEQWNLAAILFFKMPESVVLPIQPPTHWVTSALSPEAKRSGRECDGYPPPSTKFENECHNATPFAGKTPHFVPFSVEGKHTATLHFVAPQMLSVKLLNRWSLFATLSHRSNKVTKQKIFRGCQIVRLSGGLKKTQLMLSKGCSCFYLRWLRSLHLTLIFVCNGENRPVLVCDQ